MPNHPVHIMLIEDDDIDIENTKRAFKQQKIANPLHLAKDGYEALCMLKGTNGYSRLSPTPLILMIDINTPRMSGIELLRKIREDSNLKHLSAFILTTSDSKDDIKEAYQLNVAGYIQKPLEMNDLTHIANVLNMYWYLQKFPT